MQAPASHCRGEWGLTYGGRPFFLPGRVLEPSAGGARMPGAPVQLSSAGRAGSNQHVTNHHLRLGARDLYLCVAAVAVAAAVMCCGAVCDRAGSLDPHGQQSDLTFVLQQQLHSDFRRLADDLYAIVSVPLVTGTNVACRQLMSGATFRHVCLLHFPWPFVGMFASSSWVCGEAAGNSSTRRTRQRHTVKRGWQ